MTPAPPLTMLTFAPTIDSQTSRVALAAHKTSFTERDRIFGWVSLLTFFHGGYGRLPLIYGRGVHLSGSEATALWLDRRGAREKRLVPLEQPLGGRIQADFSIYNHDLGSDVAAFAYYHLLPQRKLMIESFGKPVTPLGRATLPLAYGPLRWLFSTLLRLKPGRIADVELRIEAILDWTDARVLDGRRYLHGDRLTLADVALMGSMAPILLPPSYAPNVPPLDQLPTKFRAFVERTRTRPSGRFVLGLYDELERGAS